MEQKTQKKTDLTSSSHSNVSKPTEIPEDKKKRVLEGLKIETTIWSDNLLQTNPDLIKKQQKEK